MTLAIFEDSGLSVYVLFKGTDIAVPAVAGTGLDLGWYTVAEAAVQSASLPIGVHEGTFRVGDYSSPDSSDESLGPFLGFNWNGATEVDQLADVSESIDELPGLISDMLADLTVGLTDESLGILADALSERIPPPKNVSFLAGN